MKKKLWEKIFMYALGALTFLGLFVIIALLIFNAVPESNKDALLILLGVLASGFTAVIGFFYGSSQGSMDKTDIMANGKKPE